MRNLWMGLCVAVAVATTSQGLEASDQSLGGATPSGHSRLLEDALQDVPLRGHDQPAPTTDGASRAPQLTVYAADYSGAARGRTGVSFETREVRYLGYRVSLPRDTIVRVSDSRDGAPSLTGRCGFERLGTGDLWIPPVKIDISAKEETVLWGTFAFGLVGGWQPGSYRVVCDPALGTAPLAFTLQGDLSGVVTGGQTDKLPGARPNAPAMSTPAEFFKGLWARPRGTTHGAH